MDDRSNTIAGWVLAGGIVALGASIVTGEMFHAERPEKMGYVVEGVEAEAGAGAPVAEQPIEAYLAKADTAKGANVFKKCVACHTDAKGGPNGLGPNLWSVVGEPIGQGAGGFAFSEALKSKGGNWDFAKLGQWLTSPKAMAPGTKMTFAGLSNPQDRADVIAYLNTQSDHQLPLPAAPAAGAGATGAKAAAEVADADGQKAKDQPVMTEAQAAKAPARNVAGEAAPATSGASTTDRH